MKYFALIIITSLTATSVFAESYVRIRGLQASPLLSDNAEKGKFKSGSSEIDMETPPSKYQSIMISYGSLGIGTTSITTNFSFSGNNYKLENSWLDGAYIFPGPGNTSLTIGTGFTKSGTGIVSNSSDSVISKKSNGTSWFGVLSLEYDLPVNLNFLGLKFTEILFGYRQNSIEFEDFKNNNLTIDGSLKIQTIQYQFGVGLVF